MIDAELIAAYNRACIRLSKVQGGDPRITDTPVQRTAFKRWDELDREMVRRKLERWHP